MQGRVLIVAGSDSGGAAGIQADLKTVTALGGFAATAITALTAQNTLGVFSVFPVSPEFIRQQMEVVLDDIGADCIKTGMLHLPEVIDVVAQVLEERAAQVPLVADPVMVAKSGDPLLEPSAVETLRTRLIPLATLLTPNLPEAEALAQMKILDVEDMKQAGMRLLERGPKAVLVKGGHASGEIITNVLCTAEGIEILEHPRVMNLRVHGTGDTLASAVAAGLAQGLELKESVWRACEFVQEAIRTAPGYGQGYGPMNHACTTRPFQPKENRRHA